MKAIILAAGEGVRMLPLTLSTPKPLLQFAGKTMLEHLFSALPPEITEVVLTVGYRGDQIRAYCGSRFLGREVSYREGSSAGNAIGFLSTCDAFSNGERFVVLYGDEFITPGEMRACLAHPYSWLCYSVEDPRAVGIAEVNEKGYITNVIEKPEHPISNLATDGCMVVDTSIFSCTLERHANGEYYFSGLMRQFIRSHLVKAVIGSPYHGQLGTPADIERLEQSYYRMIAET